jgi:alpha-D-ribose 1-methylphosphonate 5-triphosphate diphosphatase
MTAWAPLSTEPTARAIGTVAIERAQVLVEGRLEMTSVRFDSDREVIGELDAAERPASVIDGRDLVVLPGIVDIHADAFERQLMPRPRVHFPVDLALIESDRQAVTNGITTVFHGVTWSWEPGLRDANNARALLGAIERLRISLVADTHYHLRHETYNIAAEAEIATWLSARRIGALAFNDHMTSIVEASSSRRRKLATMVERSGVSQEDFLAVVERTKARAAEVPASISRLAAAAVAAGVPLLSHDDTGPEQRRAFRALGCRVAEFPTTLAAAQEAADGGDDVVFGAPNVVRGGSHTGWLDASEMISRGLCSVLASDHYYPAPLAAAASLVARGVVALPQAWALISEQAATAVSLDDRGRIEPGKRADLVLVDLQRDHPRVVATVVAGRIVHLAEAWRLSRSAAPRPLSA